MLCIALHSLRLCAFWSLAAASNAPALFALCTIHHTFCSLFLPSIDAQKSPAPQTPPPPGGPLVPDLQYSFLSMTQ